MKGNRKRGLRKQKGGSMRGCGLHFFKRFLQNTTFHHLIVSFGTILDMNKLIDIGVNLTDPAFRGIYNNSQKHASDLAQVLSRAFTKGISKIIITGGNLEDSAKAIELANSDERLYATVGCHPTRCLEFEEGDPENYMKGLSDLIRSNPKKVVAFGEFGLDYDRLMFCPKETQLKYFEKQLEMAKNFQLPLFLHSRNAATDMTVLLTKHRDGLKGGVVHSFDGSWEDAENFTSLNYFIGINGCSLKTEHNLEVVSKIPLNKLMLETDSPWCEIKATHASYRYVETKFESKKKEKFIGGFQVKGRNEPTNLVQVLEVISALKQLPKEEVAEKVTENTMKLFNFS